MAGDVPAVRGPRLWKRAAARERKSRPLAALATYLTPRNVRGKQWKLYSAYCYTHRSGEVGSRGYDKASIARESYPASRCRRFLCWLDGAW